MKNIQMIIYLTQQNVTLYILWAGPPAPLDEPNPTGPALLVGQKVYPVG